MSKKQEGGYRDADSWINEIVEASTVQDNKDWNEWTGDDEEPEGLVHVTLRNGTPLQFYLAQRLRWHQKDQDDDIVGWRYCTEDEIEQFAKDIRPSAELAAKASKFINDLYTEMQEVNEQMEKRGVSSGTMALIMNFSLNCSLTESGTMANMSSSDMRRVANELMMTAMGQE